MAEEQATSPKHADREESTVSPAAQEGESSATAQRAADDKKAGAAGDEVEDGQQGEGSEEGEEDDERDSDKASEEEEEGETKAADQPPLPGQGAAPGQPHSWQAVWAPQQGAYYFWNAKTNETTWVNPLAPASSAASTGASASSAAPTQAQSDEDFAAQHGIDPDLAFLDPQLYAARLVSARGSASQPYGASGAFDTRTGKFVPTAAVAAGHDPSRLSQVARAGRQMEVFFDVKAYENERAKEREKEQSGGDAKRQKLSKKELAAYREKKKEKRLKKWKED